MLGKSLRFVAASMICIAIVFASVLAGAYFFLQGDTGKGSVVLSRIEAGLQDVVGDQFEVKLQNVNLAFSSDARVVFKSNDVQVLRKTDGAMLSSIGLIETRVNLIEAFSGNTSIEVIRVDGMQFNSRIIGTGKGFFLPTHLDVPFDFIGDTLSRFQQSLDADKFEQFEIVNSKITGRILGRKKTDPVQIKYLSVNPDGVGRFTLNANLETELSNIGINSSYELTENQGSAYTFSATGIDVREWFSEPEVEEGVIGSNAMVKVSGNIPFDAQHKALNPTLNIKTASSKLRLGRDSFTDVNNLDLNVRLIMDKNQIELDPSIVDMGRMKATWIGGIKPYNAQKGYGGSLRYDLIMKQGTFSPTLPGEEVVPGAFQINGLYNVDDKDMLIDKIVLTTKDGYVRGKGRMLFGGETPSLKAEGMTEGISILAMKQFWPFFMADGARDWVHDHFIGGWVEEGRLSADIPPGIIFRVKEGAKIKPEEFNLDLKMKDVSFRPFGEMPSIDEGVGELNISGMKIKSTIVSGKASTDGKSPISIRSGTFEMEDFAAQPRFGETKLSLEGDATTIAKIADRKPLRVMERMNVIPTQFSGKAYADIVARFPIEKGTQYSQIDWNILLDLQDASSSRKLAGRSFTKADIVIDATPISAKVVGVAMIDGVKSRLNLVEPIGKSGKAKRKREIVATMGEDARKALGIDLDPVVKGPIDVVITQEPGVEKFKVDFTKAEVSLPWVGWSKGKGITAKASFDLKTSNGLFNLNNFKLSGAGFVGEGNLVMSKQGLISADIKKLKLNETDNVALKIRLNKGAYDINAVGTSYDARGVMNTLLYQGSFNTVQGKRSVNLTANFNEVIGFGRRSMRDVSLVYQSRNGNLTKLNVTGAGSNGARYNATAQRNGNETEFTIESTNAGNALAFTNIYTRMEGGKLTARLKRQDNGPFIGPVNLQDFTVINEPRLEKMVSNVRRQLPGDRGQNSKVIPLAGDQRVSFQLAQSRIEKGEGYLKVKDAIIRSPIIGLSLDGLVYDKQDYMKLSGTFMPANSVNLAVSAIPILGRLFANGKDRALIGITYQLSGPRSNPELLVNPLSIVTPGFFNKVFEFK